MGCHTWFYANKENLEKQRDCEFHDVFRASDWTGTELYSLDETLKYIKTSGNVIEIYTDTINRLNEFWTKYPDGVIEFG